MKPNDQPGLLYHSLHGRHLRGCFPLALLLAGLAVAAAVLFLDVVVPKPVVPRGEGEIYYRDDELIQFQIRHRTPLPLSIPVYADPARQESAAAVDNDGREKAKPVYGPAFDFLYSAPDSVVLNEDDLLALPPEGISTPPQNETPAGETPAEPEPAEENPAAEPAGETPVDSDAATETDAEEPEEEVQP